MGGDSVVEYLGTTKDVRPIISAATCVVLPSYREGAPRTLIEAAALGRPVIATDVPGCRAVVDRDVSGFLCDVRSAESLRSSIERFLKLDAEEMRAMGAAGRRKMEREFDQAIVVSAYRDVLSQFGKVR
jgi:glycosyltransferase involved in cell wall biosynthesis